MQILASGSLTMNKRSVVFVFQKVTDLFFKMLRRCIISYDSCLHTVVKIYSFPKGLKENKEKQAILLRQIVPTQKLVSNEVSAVQNANN